MLVLAENVAFEQRVAIRVLSRHLANEVEVAKFRREAKVLAKLGSEHVARIIDVGSLDDGSFYLVRQYLEGVDLASYLKQRRTLPIDEAITYALQLTEAVAETHAHGILVRELSPEHVFLSERSPGIRGGKRVAKIIDFGTAKLMADPSIQGGDEQTSTAILGLSPYSSPEMLRRQRDLDARTDVWSLGAILYEMLGGQPPFGTDVMSLAIAIVRDEPIPLGRLRRDIAPELEAAVMRTMAKNKAERPQDTHAFAASLARFAPTEGRVLMERIHDLAGAARARLGGDADDAMEVSDVEEADVEDEPTNDGDNPGTMVMGHTAQARAMSALAPAPRTVTQEKTEALGFSFMPADPLPAGRKPPGGPRFAGAAAAPTSSPRTEPPPPSVPAHTMPMPPGSQAHAGVAPAVPVSSRGFDGAAPPPSAPGAPAWMRTASPASVASPGPAASNDMGRRVALYAVGGALAAMVVLLIVVLALPSSSGPTATSASAVAAKSSASPVAAAPTGAPAPTETAISVTDMTAAPTTATAEPKPGTKKTATVATNTGVAATAATATNAPEPPKTSTAKVDPPPPAAGDKGTLVAIAVGGTCAFSVNGASKGTTNSLKLSVAPGNYTVTCKPSSGATKSKSVEVKSGASSMAMFKL